MATTTTSSTSTASKWSTTTQARYDSAVSKYWQSAVDSAMSKGNVSVWTSVGWNTAQQAKNIAGRNISWGGSTSWTTFWSTVTPTPVIKKTVQQEQNIAKANAFKASQATGITGSNGSILRPVVVKDTANKNKLWDAIAKFWYDVVEKQLNTKGKTMQWMEQWPLNPKEYVSQSWQVKSDLYPDNKLPDAQQRLTAEQLWYEEAEDIQAKKKADLIEETARKEREAVEEANKPKEDRILSREQQLQWVFGKYNTDTEASKKAIAENLDAIKRTQSIAANAAAAQSGQWPWLSEWARQQVEADIANRAAANINKATWEAISQTQWLTESQKTAWLESSNEQTRLDILKDTLSDAEWNVFIKSVQDVWLTKTLAKDEFAKYLRTTNQAQLEWTFNRAEMQKKVDSWYNDFNDNKSSPVYKAAIIEQILWDHPSYKLFRNDVFKMINAWEWFQTIIDNISERAEADYRKYTIAQNVAIQDKNVINPEIMKWVEEAFKSYNK